MTSKSTEMRVDVGAAFRLVHKKLDCHCPSYGPNEDDKTECSNCKALATVGAALEELTELRRMLRRWMVWAASEEQDEETHGEEFMSIWFDTESLGIVLEQLDAVEASRTPTPEEK